ncbi:hypothetical protein N9934_03655 [Desulfosarcina sp.]|nr:hypothetical protein [Desulfosarcina sp.]
MKFGKGDFVKNSRAQQWGVGIIHEASTDYLDVFFEAIDEQRTFKQDNNPLVKVECSEDGKKKIEKAEIRLYGPTTLEEKIERDLKNAKLAVELAKKERLTFNSDIDSLAAISERPFDAMVEVNGDQLWYANQYLTTNMPLGSADKRVVILTWTHPGVQIALAGELLEPYDISSNQYTLTEVTTKARAKFKRVLPDISGLYEPGGQVGVAHEMPMGPGLKAVKLEMTLDQVKAFISKMNGMMLVSGAPGSGKTTVAMQRIRFLFDQQDIRKDDQKIVSYKAELTRVFLANQNLIDHTKKLLENDLLIPSRIVVIVSAFIREYLSEIWAYKHGARSRQKKLFVYDARGRRAFYGLCNTTHLKDCWQTFEIQVSERLAQAGDAEWYRDVDDKSITTTSKLLSDALKAASKKGISSDPSLSKFSMDSVYYYVSRTYESLRTMHKHQGSLEKFDTQFQHWLYWVYDPLDGIITYFEDQLYEGGVRIKSGIGAKIPEADIIDNIRADWNERKYGAEMEAWLSFLLRFALPVEVDSRKRFREIPNPLSVSEYAGERWSHVMVDEAQDISVAEAALLSSFVHPDGAFTVSADFNQVVSPVWGMKNPDAFKVGSSLKDKDSYQSYPFAKNMRQSKQIGLFLQSFYQNIFRELAPFDSNDEVQGPVPLLMVGRSSEFPARIRQRIAVMKRNPNINSIALLQIDENEHEMEQFRSELVKLGLELAPIWASTDSSRRLITTSVERIKGLEYDACFVIGMDDIENSALNYTKNRAYVALSRPAFYLTILCSEMPDSLQKIDNGLVEILRL